MKKKGRTNTFVHKKKFSLHKKLEKRHIATCLKKEIIDLHKENVSGYYVYQNLHQQSFQTVYPI